MSLFGPGAVMGDRTKMPKSNTSFFPVRGTSMNIVVGCIDEEREEFLRYTARRGIDFCFDGSLLNLSVRYQRHLHGSPACPSPLLQDCLRHGVGDPRERSLGLIPSLRDEFECEGIVYVVHRMDVQLCRFFAKPMETNSNEEGLMFSTAAEIDNLKPLIYQYLS
jgi:hypothetical protein